MKTFSGDTHNFGIRVQKLNKAVLFKPRPVYWEWLFLSAKSPLRILLKKIEDESTLNGLLFPSSAFPDLHFYGDENLLSGGRVQICSTRASLGSKRGSFELFELYGGLISFCSWFGIEDIHKDNLHVGRGKDHRMIICPLDIESLFLNIWNPAETLLIPNTTRRQAVSGAIHFLSNALPSSARARPRHLAALAAGYHHTLSSLRKYSRQIINVLNAQPGVKRTPLRTGFRHTHEYYSYLQNPVKTVSARNRFFPEELLQLDRGDIPYFFRFLGKKKIYYYIEPGRNRFRSVKLKRKYQSHASQLNLNHRFSSTQRVRVLSEEGLMIAIAAFDDKRLNGTSDYKGYQLRLSSRTIQLSCPQGEILKAPRNWSDYVLDAHRGSDE